MRNVCGFHEKCCKKNKITQIILFFLQQDNANMMGTKEVFAPPRIEFNKVLRETFTFISPNFDDKLSRNESRLKLKYFNITRD